MPLHGYKAHVLLCHERDDRLSRFSDYLSHSRYKVHAASNAALVMRGLEEPDLDLAVVHPPLQISIIENIARARAGLPVVAICDDAEQAEASVRAGAQYALCDADRHPLLLERAVEQTAALARNRVENEGFKRRLEEEVARRTESLENHIRERVQAEELLRISLNEKEFMIKEIHHRVRHNLQVISSLLNLQAAYIKSSDSLSLFKQSQNRIQAMSLAHELLYRSENLTRVDFKEYVKRLIRDLARAYGTSDISYRLSVREGTTISASVAIPCGLILNELVTNSITHAFTGEMPTRQNPPYIKVEAVRNEGFMSIAVHDNGRGLPAGMDFRKAGSLGFQLVTSLINQLQGSIEPLEGPGVSFLFRFPLLE